MATREQLIEDFADHKLATGEKFVRLINSTKAVQEPVADPAASGTSLSFIDSISQDADGKITATKKTLDLANAHELNPFKGWYKTGDTLPTDGFDGAYLYFKDTSELTGQTTIYRWNGTAYADTGTVVDTSNVQTFETGQQVNGVAIDNSGLANPAANALAKAGDVMQLAAKLEGVTAVETKAAYTAETGEKVKGDGTIETSSYYDYMEIPIIGYGSVRFRGVKTRSNASDSVKNAGYALLHYENGNEVIDFSSRYELNTETTSVAKEYILSFADYPNATHFRTNCYVSGVYEGSDFYCYLQKGHTVKEDIDTRTMRKNILSKYVGKNFNRTIVSSTNQWEAQNYSLCSLIDITKERGKKLHVVKSPSTNTHVAFLKTLESFTDPAPYCDGTSLVLLTNSTQKEVVLDIPQDAVWLYVKLMDGNSARYTAGPKLLEILDDENIVPANTYVKKYDDTWIEENIFQVDGAFSDSSVNVRNNIYKIDKSVNYKIILAKWTSDGVANGVEFLAEDMHTVLGTAYPLSDVTEETLYEMEDLTIPSGCGYIRINYRVVDDSTTVSAKGIGALMKPLLDDGKIPTNRNVFCVSKIYTPIIPNGYDGEAIEQTEVWSAWSFMMPVGAGNYIHGGKYPICSWYHGSSTCLTNDHFGNKGNFDSTSMPYEIRKLGCIVFDINGYGISYKVDDKARHWGCPLAVETAKKAYEIIVERFNGKRGMIQCGWSMGGALAKSYAMTYPEDVVVCALFAPSEIGGNGRFHNPVSSADYHVSEESMAHAWGYATYQDMYGDHTMAPFIGYSPCVKPLVVEQNGNIRKMTDEEFLTSDSISSDTNRFVGYFPVEVKVWAGTADNQVPYYFAPWFVNTVRNAGGNATLRTCNGAGHSVFTDYKTEIIGYLNSKISAR